MEDFKKFDERVMREQTIAAVARSVLPVPKK